MQIDEKGQIRYWLKSDDLKTLEVGVIVECCPDALALGAYVAAADGKTNPFYVPIQMWDTKWEYSKLYKKDGWKPRWPDLVRVEWEPAPLTPDEINKG